MGGGGRYNRKRNREAVLQAIPEKRGVVDDWNDMMASEKKEAKMKAQEEETGRCARCGSILVNSRRGYYTLREPGERRIAL